MESTTTSNWPDLSIDQRAWQQAKEELGAAASISAIALRAQQIKQAYQAAATSAGK